MANKTETSAGQENNTPLVDPQKKYLMDQFGDLMEQVGDGFGGPLQEELISRLQQTIADFHEEVNEMLTKLKENSEKRHEKLKEIWDNPDGSIDSEDDEKLEEPQTQVENKEMSEWEKKLESADAKLEEKPKKEEPPKKKGFFGRKKK
jgi:outer membrane biosynthesis protein TonB